MSPFGSSSVGEVDFSGVGKVYIISWDSESDNLIILMIISIKKKRLSNPCVAPVESLYQELSLENLKVWQTM